MFKHLPYPSASLFWTGYPGLLKAIFLHRPITSPHPRIPFAKKCTMRVWALAVLRILEVVIVICLTSTSSCLFGARDSFSPQGELVEEIRHQVSASRRRSLLLLPLLLDLLLSHALLLQILQST